MGKNKEPTAAMLEQKKEAEREQGDIEQTPVGQEDTNAGQPEQPSLTAIIANQSLLWWQTQVLQLLIELKEAKK